LGWQNTMGLDLLPSLCGRGEWASSWAVPRWAQVVFGPNEQTRHENTVTMLQVFHRPHLTGIRKASS